jgi:hypothetical protein
MKFFLVFFLLSAAACLDDTWGGRVGTIAVVEGNPSVIMTEECEFEDALLEDVLLEEFDFDHDDVISRHEGESVARLSIPRGGWGGNSVKISSLTGLAECFTALEQFTFKGESTDGFAPLADMGTLTGVSIWSDNLSELSFLEDLPLEALSLRGGDIEDITPLAGLASLTMLIITESSVTDITPLAGLRNLNRVFLSENEIRDVGPLRALPELEILALNHNEVADLTSLMGLGKLKKLFLSHNPLDCATQIENLENLKLQVSETDFDVSEMCP